MPHRHCCRLQQVPGGQDLPRQDGSRRLCAATGTTGEAGPPEKGARRQEAQVAEAASVAGGGEVPIALIGI